VSWQIVPDALGRMLQDPDRAKANRVMEAMMKMVKLDIALLEQAYRGAWHTSARPGTPLHGAVLRGLTTTQK
jgi:hypothetical protein